MTEMIWKERKSGKVIWALYGKKDEVILKMIETEKT